MLDKNRLIFDWHKLKIKIDSSLEYPNFFFKKEIWWANLGVNIGHEEDGKNKTFERPILILKKINKHLLLIIPLSSAIKENKNYYFKFLFKDKYRSALISQIRAISSKRLIRRMGKINNSAFKQIITVVKNF